MPRLLTTPPAGIRLATSLERETLAQELKAREAVADRQAGEIEARAPAGGGPTMAMFHAAEALERARAMRKEVEAGRAWLRETELPADVLEELAGSGQEAGLFTAGDLDAFVVLDPNVHVEWGDARQASARVTQEETRERMNNATVTGSGADLSRPRR